ncbi:hypothetical protein JQ628_22785 [Bradyrhizobium lablabi]|uniref:DUF6522 family protein n=1 Tax=Bradyrhizobium lablabi TaxID=722472 RepID=UPI001BA6705C|nr:DUF6522 family protein [Bradyrhizobium lablabi]MBR1124372.1 hypothetical protein [Bradyrhizobium lablabi]
MKPVDIRDGVIEVEASVIAEGLGLALPQFREDMRAGKITTMTERGTDADLGRHRLTFFSKHRRFRLVIDQSGTIIQRSALDFGGAPLPRSVRKPGR